MQITFRCQQLCSHFVKLLRIMRASGGGKLLSIKCLRSSKPDMQMRSGDIRRQCAIRGLPSSNDLINPFYVLSWRRPRLAGNAGGCDWGPTACLRLSAFAFSCSPAIHIQIQIVGVALSRHLLTAPLAALMIHSAKAKETQGASVFKFTAAARNKAVAEAEVKTEPAWDAHTQSQTQTHRQRRRHCQYA